MAYSHLQCLYCEEVWTTARKLYFHYRSKHEMNHYQATDATCDSLTECQKKRGRDNNIDANDRDYYNNTKNWELNYKKKNFKYFDRLKKSIKEQDNK